MGVGIRGLINDVVAVLPIDDWAALLDKKLETEEFFQNLVTANLSSAFVVSIHFVYVNVSCCLFYVHTSA